MIRCDKFNFSKKKNLYRISYMYKNVLLILFNHTEESDDFAVFNTLQRKTGIDNFNYISK